MGNEYLQVFLNLFAILILVFATIYVAKKFKFAKYGKNNYINILQIVPIGAKEKIILIKLKDNFILLGATSQRVDVLHASETLEPLRARESKVEKKSFTDLMAAFKEEETEQT